MTASDWERAGAVIERLWDAPHVDGAFSKVRHADGSVTALYRYRDWAFGAREQMSGTGPTYVAALIDLGARLEGGE